MNSNYRLLSFLVLLLIVGGCTEGDKKTNEIFSAGISYNKEEQSKDSSPKDVLFDYLQAVEKFRFHGGPPKVYHLLSSKDKKAISEQEYLSRFSNYGKQLSEKLMEGLINARFSAELLFRSKKSHLNAIWA